MENRIAAWAGCRAAAAVMQLRCSKWMQCAGGGGKQICSLFLRCRGTGTILKGRRRQDSSFVGNCSLRGFFLSLLQGCKVGCMRRERDPHVCVVCVWWDGGGRD